jgi:hypothetical protein
MTESGKRQNSKTWIVGAFSLTQQHEMAADVVCIDDCPNCPLWKKGCAGKCQRWDDLVCSTCPCLGSKYQDSEGVTTVNASSLDSEPISEKLRVVHALRKRLSDGQSISDLVV